MPSARLMAGLEPVARMALPCSVPKYQYSTATITAAITRPVRMAAGTWREVMNTGNLSGLTDLLAAMPMMCRLME